MSRLVTNRSCLGVLSIGLVLFAARTVRAAPAPESLLKQMVTKYQKVSSFEERFTMSQVTKAGPQEHKVNLTGRFTYQKPNRFLYRVDDPMMGMTAVSDGKTLWFCMNMMKQYTKQPAPAQLSGLAQAVPMLKTQLDPFAFLRGEDPLAGKPKVKLVGEQKVAGKPCYHLAWAQAGPSHMGGSPPRMSVDVWVGKADLLLYQTRFVASGSMGQAKYTTTITEAHTGMKVNQPVPGKTFTFAAPEGAKQVDKFGMPGAPGKPKPAPSKAR